MILRPGHNVWRIERASRAAVIVDAADYFGAVRAALLKAKRSAFIIGWDIHSRTRLVGTSGRAEDGYPETFAEFLSALVEKHPALQISLLLWDFAVLYAPERELFPTYTLRWNTPKRVRFCLDDAVPIGSSQHQKLVVVDDAVAFTGGLDITVRRWDTSDHCADNPLRCDPYGHPYEPFHDVQIALDGEAARALAHLARVRWECAAHEKIRPVEPAGDPWPDGISPDFTDVELGIARTQPGFEQQEEVREIERLLLESIAGAERSIYVENQFLSSIAVAKALAERLRAAPQLEVLIVAPATHASALEAGSMRNGRIRFIQVLRECGAADRVRLMSPVVNANGKIVHTMVHSKLMIVDDHLLHIGSANLNNRSMGTDTECNIAIEADGAAERERIATVRARLLGDHCGVPVADVAKGLAANASLIGLAERLTANGHALHPIEDGAPDNSELSTYFEDIADPEKPIGAEEFIGSVLGGLVSRRSLSNIVKIAAAGVVVLGLVLAWNLSPLSEFAKPERVRHTLQSFAADPWGPAVVLAIFVGGTLLLFPVTILIAATAAAFGPWLGFVYATAGTLTSALVAYGVGVLIGREALIDVLGPRLNRIRQRVRRRGVLAVALVRLVPVAPFGIVNLVAGASEIRLLDYILGTLIGMMPGIIALAALGHQITRMLTQPSVESFVWLALAVVGWIALSLGVQALVSKYWSGRR